MSEPSETQRQRPAWVWAAAAILFVLHHDFWWWDSRTLLFGFLPIGLGYHALFSILAALVWAAAVRFAWPDHIEEWADEFEGAGGESIAPTAGPAVSGVKGEGR